MKSTRTVSASDAGGWTGAGERSALRNVTLAAVRHRVTSPPTVPEAPVTNSAGMPSTLAQRHSQLPAAPVCPAALHRLSGPSTDQPTGRRLQELQLPYLSTPRSSSTTLKGVTIAWRSGYRKYVPAFEAVPAAVSSGPSGRPVAAKFVSPDSVGERFGPSPKADLSAGRCPVVWSGGFMNGWSAGMWGAGRRARVSRLVVGGPRAPSRECRRVQGRRGRASG